MSQRQPILNAPGVVVAVIGALVTVQLARAVLSDAADERLVEMLAFIPERLGDAGGALPGGRVAALTQFFTHVFVHGDWVHLGINCAWLVAFGPPVARRIGTARFLAFFLACGIGGAVFFLIFNSAPMVGASGAISGLMGATLRFLFVPLLDHDAEALAGTRRPHLSSLSASFTDRRILIAIATWTLINVLVALAAPTLFEGRNIAWEAHLGGFFTGLLTFGLFDPPPPHSQ
ncbi:MAG: rhomboid family intramembrane serine protease [Hyphomicrobiaceae bacterium]|nr:rhomboid family intramembrane serine protease [Hyphomicrobiaceae bacterium]